MEAGWWGRRTRHRAQPEGSETALELLVKACVRVPCDSGSPLVLLTPRLPRKVLCRAGQGICLHFTTLQTECARKVDRGSGPAGY